MNVFCFPARTSGQHSQMPTAATDATVKADTVTVFLEMDTSSDQVSTLKKGVAVYVDLRMDQGGKSWCGIRPSAQANRIGFVDCRSLERVAGPSVSCRQRQHFLNQHTAQPRRFHLSAPQRRPRKATRQ